MKISMTAAERALVLRLLAKAKDNPDNEADYYTADNLTEKILKTMGVS